MTTNDTSQMTTDTQRVADLRIQLQASFENRAILYYLIFDELREEIGEERAKDLLKRAIYRRGEQVGQQFAQHSPCDLAGLKEAFLGIIPDEGRLFAPEVMHCEPQSLEIHLNHCPLKNAWDKLGLDDRTKALMCEIAGEIDKGTFEGAGFSFEPDTWEPGRSGCCHLHIQTRS